MLRTMQNEVERLRAEWGSRVTSLRSALGLTVDDLAERCGVHETTIRRVELARVGAPDDLKWRIAGALGVRADVLWAWPAVIPPKPAQETTEAVA